MRSRIAAALILSAGVPFLGEVFAAKAPNPRAVTTMSSSVGPKNSAKVELETLKAKLQSTSTSTCEEFKTPQLDQLVTRPRVGVGCVLLCPELHPGQVVIGERKGSHGAGKVALPGGHLEFAKEWADCAQDETQEECGIDIEASRWRLLTVTNDIMPADDRHYITIFMVAHISAEEASAIVNEEPDKCVAWEWVDFSRLRDRQMFIPLSNFLNAGGVELMQSASSRTVA